MSGYVMLKGVQGWGDRLQSLLQAIGYAKRTERTLVVDWRDADWTHDPSEELEVWLSLIDVWHMPLREFLDSVVPESVEPVAWASCLADPGYAAWVYGEEYWFDAERDSDAEVVVLPGVGRRTFDAADFYRHLELNDSVRASIVAVMPLKPYDVVHLRGGSKRWCGGTVALRDLDERIHTTWPSEEAYLEHLSGKYAWMVQGLEPATLYAVSDHATLLTKWRQRHACHALPTYNHQHHESGTHKVPPGALRVPKALLTYEALRDFVLMLNARRVVGDGVSLFSFMASLLHPHMDPTTGWYFP